MLRLYYDRGGKGGSGGGGIKSWVAGFAILFLFGLVAMAIHAGTGNPNPHPAYSLRPPLTGPAGIHPRLSGSPLIAHFEVQLLTDNQLDHVDTAKSQAKYGVDAVAYTWRFAAKPTKKIGNSALISSRPITVYRGQLLGLRAGVIATAALDRAHTLNCTIYLQSGNEPQRMFKHEGVLDGYTCIISPARIPLDW